MSWGDLPDVIRVEGKCKGKSLTAAYNGSNDNDVGKDCKWNLKIPGRSHTDGDDLPSYPLEWPEGRCRKVGTFTAGGPAGKMVNRVGLEPTDPDGSGFTARRVCRSATDSKRTA